MSKKSALLGAAATLFALSACSGGASPPTTRTPPPPAPPTSPVTPAPVSPPPSPAPAPAPTPAPPSGLNIGGTEYVDSDAARQADALTAYQRGIFGEGVTIAVVDSGIDVDNSEFAGRIHPLSADVAGDRGIDDIGGHGTAVSAVAAAADDDRVMHGVAPLARILVARADEPESCEGEDGCSYPDLAIATGVDLAVAAGARAVNISLGGTAVSPSLLRAIQRATAAGTLIVIAAGNDGEPDPDDFALVALDEQARGRVIIAGSVSQSSEISSFSDRAGIARDVYLTALGERVRSFDEAGGRFLYSGTSFAAPAITGAIALLAEAFPNLTPDQIVDLLFSSANDRGAPGVDAVYGQGELNIGRAFRPAGSLTVAGTAVAATASGSGFASGGAAGDAATGLQSGLAAVVATDRFARAYQVDLSGRAESLPVRGVLAASLHLAERGARMQLGDARFTLSAASAPLALTGSLADRGLDAQASAARPVRRGFAQLPLAQGATALGAMGYSADDLARLATDMPGVRRPSYLASRPADALLPDEGAAARFTAGSWTFAAAASREWREAAFAAGEDVTAHRLHLRAVRPLGGLVAAVSYERLEESNGFLGSSGSALLGIGGSATDIAGASLELPAIPGWTLRAEGRAGRTRIRLTEGLAAGSDALLLSGFSIALEGVDVLRLGDRAGIRVSQPLRVESGGLRLAVPTGYDYALASAATSDRFAGLSPSGRELALEGAYGWALSRGSLEMNAFARRNAGHISGVDDLGVALRLFSTF